MDDYLTRPLQSHELDRALSRWIEPDWSAEPATEPAASTAEPPDSPRPVLDPEVLAQLAELGGDVIAELGDIFLAEIPGLREQIDRAIEQEDAGRLRFSAHRLRSEARTWGVYRLDQVLLALEELGATGTTAGALAQIPELEQALAEMVAALEIVTHPGA
jgi:HPt (histidine-containing phosphotransfer) domain-containing protein